MRRARLIGWLLTGRFGRVRGHLADRRLARTLLRTGLFDAAAYRAQAGLAAGDDPLVHYLDVGRQAGLSPHPAFDAGHYVGQVPAAAGDAVAHYLAQAAGDPSPRFDQAWYRAAHGVTGNPLLHHLAHPHLPTNPAVAALQAGQRAALGADLPGGRVVVGIVTYDTPAEMLQRAVASVRISYPAADILLLDNGGPASAAVDAPALPSGGNVGFGAGHNRLMAAAWAGGAAWYVALNPDAALHPGALPALLRMGHAAGGRALVQAIQFPAEHTVPYDRVTFETPWISGACMLIPRLVHDAIGGFDETIFMYCEDVDISWRARTAGFRTLTCPAALLFHPTTDRVLHLVTHRMFLRSALVLGVRWGSPSFAAHILSEMAVYGAEVPDTSGIVPFADTSMADFSNGAAFAPVRW